VGFLSSFSLFPPVEIQSETLPNKPATSWQKLIALRLQVLHTHTTLLADLSDLAPGWPTLADGWPRFDRTWQVDDEPDISGHISLEIIKKNSFHTLARHLMMLISVNEIESQYH